MNKQQFKNLKIGDKIHYKICYYNGTSEKATIIKYDKKNNEYTAINKENNVKLFINKYSYWRFKK